ncbi:uncharacterized protein LOC100555565 [Anolis carolinensis]|uniref:uncharacterized protein LOC100555565 n=1 Tax=Anolis carolinensis TaxID=28377 RepID=UPI000462C560|nr:PREDICTED: uncharacterized protein LOC100555565 [Anolis carolinensis]|eukprot:XP_003227810.2 PREDICTED: uncharacterized protein LOC100555565 [Anolis carolinensis]
MTQPLWHYKCRGMAHCRYTPGSERNRNMKILYVLFAVLLLGLLQGPEVAEAKIKTRGECEVALGGCFTFFCPRGSSEIGKCSFAKKCCVGFIGK